MAKNQKGIYGIAGITSYVKPNNNGKIDLQSELKNFLEGVSDKDKLVELLQRIVDLIPAYIAEVINTINIADETNGDITITYDDGKEEQEDNNNV